MKIFGYRKDDEQEDLLEMGEVTFQATPADLRDLAEFLTRTAELIEKRGNEFSHAHFRDVRKRKTHEPDVVVSK